MLIPPPLPESWPFDSRNSHREQSAICGIELPGLTGNWQIVGSIGLCDFSETKCLDGLFGRGALIKSGDYILRPYYRGGLVRHFNKNTYFTAGRFKTEYDVHIMLWNAGFPTVEPVGYAYRRRFWGFEGVFITRMVDAVPWPKVWESADYENHVTQIAQLIKSLSTWGLWAPDLNATNFIVTPNGQLLALDWDRADWMIKHKRDLFKSYWARLERSMCKLNAPTSLIDSLRNNLIGGS